MTKKDITDIISIICPNDEDFEKVIISPAYLKKELEALALEQEPCEDVLDKIRAEISEFKDDKIIHAERNEMIDIVLEILDKYKAERSEE